MHVEPRRLIGAGALLALGACGQGPAALPDSAFAPIDLRVRGVACGLSVSAAMAPALARDPLSGGGENSREVHMTRRGDDVVVDVVSWNPGHERGPRTHERFVFHRAPEPSVEWCPTRALRRTEG